MDTMEKDLNALSGLFQHVMNDMKSSYPIWEDFTNKSAKLHTALRTVIVASGAFLEAFQKVADTATNTKGATRDIGSALTRICMRHKHIEGRLKTFNNAIMEQMVTPLQEKMEEWKKNVAHLDKEHTKETKRARADLKKASSDTIRLQKKVRKGSTNVILGKNEMQNKLDVAMKEVNERFAQMEDQERSFVRQSLIEERSRFCFFISVLKPVVDEEVHMLQDVTHLQEIIHSLCMQASDPHSLPASSEQVILDLRSGTDKSIIAFQTPPSSPSSLGSRKSSMCSISSINSSASGGSGSTHSPSHHFRHNRAPSQPLPPGSIPHRLSSVSSQDSGFTSQDTLFLKPPSPQPLDILRRKSSIGQDSGGGSSGGSSGSGAGTDSAGTTPSPSALGMPNSNSMSTWSNWPDLPQHYQKQLDQTPGVIERPHTISTAYEKSHNRPHLNSNTFEPPGSPASGGSSQSGTAPQSPNPYAVPVLPGGRPKLAEIGPPMPGPKPRIKAVTPPCVPSAADNQLPIYVNQHDLAALGKTHLDEVNEEEEEYEEDDEAMTPTPNRQQSIEAAVAAQQRDQEQQKAADMAEEKLESDDYSLAMHDVLEQQSPNMTPTSPQPPQSLGLVEKITRPPQAPNSSELADAIRELEASTAALQLAYENESTSPNPNNRNSLQCSSGYGTMTNTPACSEDTIAMQEVAELPPSPSDHDLPPPPPDMFSPSPPPPPPPPSALVASSELPQYATSASTTVNYAYATLPRNRSGSTPVNDTATIGRQRPLSTNGMPFPTVVTSANTATIRRSSIHANSSTPKPPPPIRRTPSMPGGRPHIYGTPVIPAGILQHRRTMSDINTGAGEAQAEPEYADPQELMAAVMTQSCPVASPAGIYMTPHMMPDMHSVEYISSASHHSMKTNTVVESVTCVGSVPSAQCTDVIVAGVPPPPPPAHGPFEEPDMTQEESMDIDLPPPPPPEELEADIYASTLQVMGGVPMGQGTMLGMPTDNGSSDTDGAEQSEYAELSIVRQNSGDKRERRKVGSIVDTHASIIANLNAKFLAQPGSIPGVADPGKPPISPGSGPQTNQGMSHSQSSESDTTPTAENPPTNGLLGQIVRGVPLKQTVSNDRSAPKFK